MCYNLVFNINILKNNYGFFSMFLLLFIQLILFFIFLIKRLKPIKNFMYTFKFIKLGINSLPREEIISNTNKDEKKLKKYSLIKKNIKKTN